MPSGFPEGALVCMHRRRPRVFHYALPVTGAFNARTSRAAMARRKVNARRRVDAADSEVICAVLAGRGGWRIRHPGTAGTLRWTSPATLSPSSMSTTSSRSTPSLPARWPRPLLSEAIGPIARPLAIPLQCSTRCTCSAAMLFADTSGCPRTQRAMAVCACRSPTPRQISDSARVSRISDVSPRRREHTLRIAGRK